MDGISLGFGEHINGALRSKIEEEFEKSEELRGLFPEASERRKVARRILGELDRRFPPSSGLWNNAKFVELLRVMGKSIISEVVGQAFAQSGVNDPGRTQAWIAKIQQPFETCVRRAGMLIEAGACWESSQSVLSSNVALGVTHEVVRGQIASGVPEVRLRDSLIAEADATALKCLSARPAPLSPKECVLRSVRNGVLQVTRISLQRKLGEKLGERVLEQLLAREGLWSSYESCVSRSASGPDFQDCIDRLVIGVGAAAAGSISREHPGVVEAIPQEEERRRLIEELGVKPAFAECMTRQKARDQRIDGQLDSRPCELLIENRITRGVFERKLEDGVRAGLSSGESLEARKIAVAGMQAMDGCWSDSLQEKARQACIRRAIIRVAEIAAAKTLRGKMPEGLFEARPELENSLLSSFSACLSRELPTDILREQERARQLEKCSGRLRRASALPAAEFQVSAAFSGRMSPIMFNNLMKTKVREEFAACLGPAPSESTLGRCSLRLIKGASNFAANVIIPETLRAYFHDEKIALTPEFKKAFDDFLTGNLRDLSACFDRELVLEKLDRGGEIAESCFKKSIPPVASYLAQLQFDLQTAAMYSGNRERWLALRKELMGELDACAKRGLDGSRAIQAYIDYVKDCGSELALRASSVVGKDQILLALDANLPELGAGAPGASTRAELRERLKGGLLAPFEQCLGKARPQVSADRNSCTESLQREATHGIASAVGQAKTVDILGSAVRPELSPIGAALRECVARSPEGKKLSPALEGCVKRYSIDMAKAVGGLKLRSTLAKLMGSRQYAGAGQAIEKSLGDYSRCLDRANGQEFGIAFNGALDECTSRLTGGARGIVYEAADRLMGRPVSGAGPRDNALAAMARAIPCLDGLTADQPAEDIADAGVDAEGLLEAMVRMIKDYVDYDAKKAELDVQAVLKQLWADLATLPAGETRKKLLELLVKRGVLDQVIKGIVRGNVREAFDSLPPGDRLAEDVRSRLLEPANFERIFAGEAGGGLSRKILDGIVRPAVLEGKSMSDPAVAQALAEVRQSVAEALIESPHFGTVLIASGVQKELDTMNGVTRTVARMLYGREALKWSEVRRTTDGQEAERYIREMILRPKALGLQLSESEEKKRLEGAKGRVTKAVKSYGSRGRA
ncbi:MAG: hypothetical protein NDJ89_00710 [Oligoflexia bacterium]|nr:hypothetical protein [Oligoflexia bacterium]